MNNLARFRADPSKVRVSIRRDGDLFVLRVESRTNPARNNASTLCAADRIEWAMYDLLELAAKYIEGIDLEMEWTYPHPMRAT